MRKLAVLSFGRIVVVDIERLGHLEAPGRRLRPDDLQQHLPAVGAHLHARGLRDLRPNATITG